MEQEPGVETAARVGSGLWTSERRPTINDVARVAGVSRQTVSNVVRGQGRVGDETRVRVLRAAEEIGYEAHAGARSMRSRRAGSIGHPLPRVELSPGNLGMLEFVQALVNATALRDQRLMLTEGTDGHGSIEGLVRSGSVDGLVLASIEAEDERARLLARLGVPFSCFGRTELGPEISWIDVDSRAAIRGVTEHLLTAGHRRLAYVGYRTGARWDLEREQGFRDAMGEAGLEAHVVHSERGAASEHATLERVLAFGTRPTAIVTGSDVLAAAAYAVSARLGLTIGTDIAVTGMDGGALSLMLTPTLTTVEIPFEEIALHVVDDVLAQVGGSTERPQRLLTARLRLGEST